MLHTNNTTRPRSRHLRRLAAAAITAALAVAAIYGTAGAFTGWVWLTGHQERSTR